MRYLILIITIIVLSACVSKRIDLAKGYILENKFVSFKSPSNGWVGYKKGKSFNYKNVIYLMSYPKSASYDIDISTDPYKWWKADYFFDKNTDYEEQNKKAIIPDERDKEQGVTYQKAQTQYLLGLKCFGDVFSRGFKGSLYKPTIKNYSITCGYYDKTVKQDNGKRILRIGYRYLYSGMRKDKKEHRTRLEVENELKNDVKKLISTLKIKNFDKEKMIKEGLYHPNKIYKNMKW